MRWQSVSSVRPASSFIEPCIPTKAVRASVGSDWVYEIKHDGYRLMVRKTNETVRVYTRRGADWTKRFPRIVQAARKIKATPFLLDGGIVYDGTGMPSFDLQHSHECDREVSLCAFDLLELAGTEVRKQPLVERTELLADFLAKVKDGIEFNDHIEGVAGSVVFDHACKLGHEGIVAKRKDLPHESGRSKRWIKIKNRDSPAMKRGGRDVLAGSTLESRHDSLPAATDFLNRLLHG